MNRHLTRKLACLCILMTLFLLAGCSAGKSEKATESKKVLIIGAIPAHEKERAQEGYKPLMEYLEKKLNMKVQFYVATDYMAAVEAMRAKTIDIGLFGAFSYVIAADTANAEAFVAESRKGVGKTYKSYLLVNPELGIKTVADLKGKTFAFVDPASTSGNIIPRAMMKKQGIMADTDLTNIVYAGKHELAALAVKNRKTDAGACSSFYYAKMKKSGELTDKDVTVLHESDPIPSAPWAWRKDLSPELKQKLKDAFLALAVESPAALKTGGGGIEKYESVTDKDYDAIREVAKLMNLDLSKMK